eukprot:CAMPEP_0184301668 /NCGR_PEP_ID=MMETSP1049-20130417/11815_1 /TAXON_ID=77928 /ORGANISM="Proteomonas sulcata, Strain CCMP704" /LENGTH=485 /DNA_ID=CAMNT_0026612727 /DNA_START=288 /DNA_END=1745 /DNA_ORIENTATION=-
MQKEKSTTVDKQQTMDLGLETSPGTDGCTDVPPLIHLLRYAQQGQTIHLQKLLDQQDRSAISTLVSASENNDGWTAAHFAALFGHLEILVALTKADKAVLWKRTSRNDETPAHKAARRCHQDILAWFLEQDPALLKIRDSCRRSAVDILARELGKDSSVALTWIRAASVSLTVSKIKHEGHADETVSLDPGSDVGHPNSMDTPNRGGDAPSRLSDVLQHNAHEVSTPDNVCLESVDSLNFPSKSSISQQGQGGPVAEADDVVKGDEIYPKTEDTTQTVMETYPKIAPSELVLKNHKSVSEEYHTMLFAIEQAFGVENSRKLIDLWQLDPRLPQFLPLDLPGPVGKPLDYASLSTREQKVLDALLKANQCSDTEGMELAVHSFPTESQWKHWQVYQALAFAEIPGDREVVERLVNEYVTKQIDDAIDPVILLVSARCAGIRGWPGEINVKAPCSARGTSRMDSTNTLSCFSRRFGYFSRNCFKISN